MPSKRLMSFPQVDLEGFPVDPRSRSRTGDKALPFFQSDRPRPANPVAFERNRERALNPSAVLSSSRRPASGW